MPAIASVSIRTIFSPWEKTQEEYLDFVTGTQQSLYVVIYGMHLPPLTDILIAKHEAGVILGMILDHSQEAGRAEQVEIQRLIAAGVPMLVGTSPVHGQILHSKFSVRDLVDVESGSWNYSLSASAQSNTMTFVSSAAYAAEHLQHYHRLHAWCMLNDMLMQPAGATMAPDIPPELQATAIVTSTAPVTRRRKPAA